MSLKCSSLRNWRVKQGNHPQIGSASGDSTKTLTRKFLSKRLLMRHRHVFTVTHLPLNVARKASNSSNSLKYWWWCSEKKLFFFLFFFLLLIRLWALLVSWWEPETCFSTLHVPSNKRAWGCTWTQSTRCMSTPATLYCQCLLCRPSSISTGAEVPNNR